MGRGLAGGGGFVGQDDRQVQAVADPILDTVLKGFMDGNYALYSQYFDDTLERRDHPKEILAGAKPNSQEHRGLRIPPLFGYLQKGKTTVVLWKGKFAASAEDVLIKLVLSRREDETKVLGLWFQ